MKKIVQINQCPNCGGRLERTDVANILRCMSCDSEFETEDTDAGKEESVVESKNTQKEQEDTTDASGKGKENKPADSEFSKTEWFEYRTEYKKLLKGKDAKDCMKAFVECTNEIGNSAGIVKYVKRELSEAAGNCYSGHKEEKMNAFLTKAIKGQVKDTEKVYFYCNSGIFTSGKKGFVITDQKIVFCEKKPHVIAYEDLHKIAFDMDNGFVNIRLNGRFETTMSVIEGSSGKAHGALAALVSALAFESDPGRDPIIICEYKDDDDE